MFCVYKHTSPNGKIYIGITGKNPLKRWSGGSGYKSNTHFWNAIVKYGWDNIKHEILFDCLTKEEACEIEKTLIKQYRSNETEYGYNRSTGGDCSAAGIKWSEEHNKKTSASLMGHPVSEETRAKIREARHKQINVVPVKPSYGKNNGKSQAVIQLTLTGEFVNEYETIGQAAFANGVCHQSISDCCRGRLKKIKGFIFVYKEGR